MIFNEIKYGFTFNKGNYESERIDIAASPEHGETPEQVLEVIKAIVHGKPLPQKVDDKQLSFDLEAAGSIETSAPPKQDRRKDNPGRPPRKSKEQKEAEKGERVTAVMEVAQGLVEEAPVAGLDLTDPTVAEVVPAKEVPVEEKPKAKKFNGAVYNREMDLHKKLVGEFLNKEFPTWKSDIAKAKQASLEMNGENFLSEEGLIIDSFKEKFRELMK